MLSSIISLLPLLPLLAHLPTTSAHFHGTPAQHAARDEYAINLKRAYATSCADRLAKRGGVHELGAARRAAWAEEIRAARGLATARPALGRRQVASVGQSHQVNSTGYTVDSDPFAGGASGCVLQPEVTQGPYYVAGELIRSNVTDGQQGVPLYADFEVLDVDTCEPVQGLYLDFWHANSTGVYSGVVASGNGDSSDESNLNSTALRGVQQTNAEGYAQFTSVFPGFYTGRAVHIHIMVHQTDGTLESNSTYLGGTVAHAGQVFFDQSLITQVNALAPYSGNTQQLTANTADNILGGVWDTFDPYMSYALLGDALEDGVLAWTTLVVNMTRSDALSVAATLTESGGVESEGGGGGGSGSMGGMGGGSSAGGGMGSAPSGTRGASGSAAKSSMAVVSVGGSTTLDAAAAAAASTSSSSSVARRRVPLLGVCGRLFGA